MDGQILAAFITSGAAIVVALLGFIGSIVISLWTSRKALEAARYKRVSERRDEDLRTIYASLYEVEIGLAKLWTGHQGINIKDFAALTDSMEEANAVGNKSSELTEYTHKYALWLSDKSGDDVRAFATNSGSQ